MNQPWQGISSSATLFVGFVLSFVALGVLWIGTPWSLQFLMCIPFLAAAYAFTRAKADGRWVLLGAMPIGLLLVQFRDKDDSHAMPMLLVCAWASSVVLGWWLGKRRNETGSR